MEITEAVHVLSRHLSAPEGLLYKLSRGQGLDHDGYRELVQALRLMADDWKDREEVPKNIVALVYAIDKAFETSSFDYRDAEGEIIRKCSMEITSILIDMFEG